MALSRPTSFVSPTSIVFKGFHCSFSFLKKMPRKLGSLFRGNFLGARMGGNTRDVTWRNRPHSLLKNDAYIPNWTQTSLHMLHFFSNPLGLQPPFLICTYLLDRKHIVWKGSPFLDVQTYRRLIWTAVLPEVSALCGHSCRWLSEWPKSFILAMFH